ncbi:uncharacterized protein LOC131691640 [Topomyia yanbarensis]|uniref:uncharacterized protein LOC131691640 n=1 Tax=Topomyia yanbarensis TaxID=2498891 RepID=UPI00273AA997|nr:uncharacterized protein LOC131691640 [Topomyia yanbarensis]
MKRKRCLPAVFCVICFSILIAWVMGDIFRQQSSGAVIDADENDTMLDAVELDYADEQVTAARTSGFAVAIDHSCTLTGECKIVCKGMDVKVISGKIRKILADLLCSDIILIIDNLFVEDERISNSWLDLDVDINIDQLELKASQIIEIAPGSFDAGCLYGTSTLTLDSLQITRLEGYTFIGLSQLKVLNLKNLPLKVVEPYVLGPMVFSLTRLTVDGCLNLVSPAPFTGSLKLHNLATVSFENNVFENVISSDSFAMLPKLTNLYLRNSRINSLPKGVIESINATVKLINLERNKLKTLDEGVFDSVLDKSVKILLNGNPFVCDCGLSYLQDLIVSYPGMFDNVTCDNPADLAGELVASVDICKSTVSPIVTPGEPSTEPPETTDTTWTTDSRSSYPTSTGPTTTIGKPTHRPTDPLTTETITPTRPPYSTFTPPYTNSTSSESSSQPSPSPTPEPTPSSTSSTYAPSSTEVNLYALQCLSTAVTSINVFQTSEINIHKRSKTFVVSDAQEGAVEVLLEQYYPNSLILWFYDTSSSTVFPINIEDSSNCAEISGRTVRITNLAPNKNYIFCIFYMNEISISPFDCLPHKLLPTYGQRSWLTEDDKIIVISILISSVLVAILTGIVMTYCFINSFTTYKKACRNMSADLRLNKSATNQCYMTPVAAEQTERLRHKRSVSDSSVESGRSYVSAVVPATQFQYISWKMENRSRPSMEYYPKDPPPPPLPPHPSKRLKKQKSEIKINFQEVYDDPTSTSYTSCPPMKVHPGKH